MAKRKEQYRKQQIATIGHSNKAIRQQKKKVVDFEHRQKVRSGDYESQ